MKLINLRGSHGAGKQTMVSDEDYDLVSKFKWTLQIDKKHPTSRYVQGHGFYNGKKSNVTLHRLIMGDRPGLVIDHINRNTLDNRRENLRHVTIAENNRNQGPRTRSGIGTTRRKNGKWQAQCRINGEGIYLGLYNTQEEARKVYYDCLMKHNYKHKVLNPLIIV